MERLQRYLARCGIASRRKAEELITAGRVKVNGVTVTRLGTKIDPERDRVLVDDQPVEPEARIVIMLNKPPGYVSSVEDEPPYPSVLRLVGLSQRLYPVGRLDVPSRGLLLLTNWGELYHKLAHPRHHVPKRYRVKVKGGVSAKIITALEEGMVVEGEYYAPMKTKILESHKGYTLLEMILTQGRKRQIRRALAHLGLKVVDLERTSIGPLALGNLSEGKWRFLTPEEIESLVKGS